jgi:hypothetical protein
MRIKNWSLWYPKKSDKAAGLHPLGPNFCCGSHVWTLWGRCANPRTWGGEHHRGHHCGMDREGDCVLGPFWDRVGPWDHELRPGLGLADWRISEVQLRFFGVKNKEWGWSQRFALRWRQKRNAWSMSTQWDHRGNQKSLGQVAPTPTSWSRFLRNMLHFGHHFHVLYEHAGT